jgi:hypothetical protein
MPQFEITIFNQEVLDCLKRLDKHESFEDEWADPHSFDVLAMNEDAARAKIEKKYPPNRGFVITEISKIASDND